MEPSERITRLVPLYRTIKPILNSSWKYDVDVATLLHGTPYSLPFLASAAEYDVGLPSEPLLWVLCRRLQGFKVTKRFPTKTIPIKNLEGSRSREGRLVHQQEDVFAMMSVINELDLGYSSAMKLKFVTELFQKTIGLSGILAILGFQETEGKDGGVYA